jgi:hypothetical protein
MVPRSTAEDILHGIERIRSLDQPQAFDLSGAVRDVTKILEAVFGSSALANRRYTGVGRCYKDVGGVAVGALMQMALNARL